METLIGMLTLAPILLPGVIIGGLIAIFSKEKGAGGGGIIIVAAIVLQIAVYYFFGFPEGATKLEIYR